MFNWKCVTLIICSSLTIGCSATSKKALFERAGDTLVPSICDNCSEKPFYLHGHWVQPCSEDQ